MLSVGHKSSFGGCKVWKADKTDFRRACNLLGKARISWPPSGLSLHAQYQ
jgi:hypothetical protein